MQKKILSNGITVVYERRNTESVAIEVLIKIGSDYEPEGRKGITHFIEHMVFEGTTTRTAQELSNEIESVGGEINAVTSHEKTFFYAVVPKDYASRSFEILADILSNPTFEENAIEKEKKVVIDEIKMLEDDPMLFAATKLSQSAFEKIPAKNPVHGYPASIKKLTREQVLSFFRRFYVGSNMIISIVGNLKNPFTAVAKAFRGIPKGRPARFVFPKEPVQKRIKLKVFRKDTAHTYVTIGYKVPPINTKDFYTLEVIKAILSKGQSSRLFNEIRTKRGLAYIIGAVYEATKNFGLFVIYFSADNEKVKQILKVIFEQLRLNSLAQQEIKEAKEFLKGNFVLSNEVAKERADNNALWLSINRSPKQYLGRILNVTAADIKKVIQKFFKRNYTMVVVRR